MPSSSSTPASSSSGCSKLRSVDKIPLVAAEVNPHLRAAARRARPDRTSSFRSERQRAEQRHQRRSTDRALCRQEQRVLGGGSASGQPLHQGLYWIETLTFPRTTTHLDEQRT